MAGATDRTVRADLGLGLALGHAAFSVLAACLARSRALDLDMERSPQRLDALLQLAAVVDVLAVAEQRAFLALAVELAAALHVRLTIGLARGLALDLTVEVRV